VGRNRHERALTRAHFWHSGRAFSGPESRSLQSVSGGCSSDCAIAFSPPTVRWTTSKAMKVIRVSNTCRQCARCRYRPHKSLLPSSPPAFLSPRLRLPLGSSLEPNEKWFQRGRTKEYALQITTFTPAHLQAMHPTGACLWFTGVCPIHSELANKLVVVSPTLLAERHTALHGEEGGGTGEGGGREACLSSDLAAPIWEWCGRTHDAPVITIWRDTPATSLANADWSEGYPPPPSSPWPPPGHYKVRGRREDTEIAARERWHADSAPRGSQSGTGGKGRWKRIYVWTEDNTYHGPNGRETPATPPGYISSQLYAQNQDMFDIPGKGSSVCWTKQVCVSVCVCVCVCVCMCVCVCLSVSFVSLSL